MDLLNVIATVLMEQSWNNVYCGLRMRRECRERFPRERGLVIPTCITARAWRTCRDACGDRQITPNSRWWENVPGIPGACATHNIHYFRTVPLVLWQSHWGGPSIHFDLGGLAVIKRHNKIFRIYHDMSIIHRQNMHAQIWILYVVSDYIAISLKLIISSRFKAGPWGRNRECFCSKYDSTFTNNACVSNILLQQRFAYNATCNRLRLCLLYFVSFIKNTS